MPQKSTSSPGAITSFSVALTAAASWARVGRGKGGGRVLRMALNNTSNRVRAVLTFHVAVREDPDRPVAGTARRASIARSASPAGRFPVGSYNSDAYHAHLRQ